MKKKTLYNTYYIGLPVCKKGPCFPDMSRVRIDKLAIGTKSFTHFGSYQNWNNPNPDRPSSSQQPIRNKNRIERWSKEYCKEILNALFYTINKLLGRNTSQRTYKIWLERIKCSNTHLDPNKLAKVRRYILTGNR